MFVLREGEHVRACVSWGGAERERERERERETDPSRLRTVSVELDVGLDLTHCDLMT